MLYNIPDCLGGRETCRVTYSLLRELPLDYTSIQSQTLVLKITSDKFKGI